MAEKGLVNRNMASLGIFIGILGKLEILKKTNKENSACDVPYRQSINHLVQKIQTLKYFGEEAVPQNFYHNISIIV